MRAEIQTPIDEVNSHYAPVEQIKRFAILPEDFSQPTGELTPPLKVKRSIVQQKYAETIDAIYRSPSDRTAASLAARRLGRRVLHRCAGQVPQKPGSRRPSSSRGVAIDLA